ncbi:hypothetical protein, partial [Brevibacillus sp. SIMBA_076]|uniref:hypothetical protein n=1 Tax=Brevibacillus sp. SIMBA_076 TaxID=3085814 RepID=UPI0039789DA4
RCARFGTPDHGLYEDPAWTAGGQTRRGRHHHPTGSGRSSRANRMGQRSQPPAPSTCGRHSAGLEHPTGRHPAGTQCPP